VGILERFVERFSGLNRAYGTTSVVGLREDGKKKVDSFVQHGEPTVDLWQKHLTGEEPSLGIIPITDDNTCRWGCIDIDDFTINLRAVNSKIQEREFPLILCRSKSGGAHLFLFTADYVLASLMRIKLAEMSASLGYASHEIFPKQTEILTERGDTGNFLNLPYFGGDNTTRYSLDEKGETNTLEQFLDHVDSKQVSPEELEKFKVITKEDKGLKGGPPCLQYLDTRVSSRYTQQWPI